MEKEIFSVNQKKERKKIRMYKQLLICLFIVILIVVVDICTQNYTKESVSHLTDDLNLLKESINNMDKENSKEQIDNTISNWDERYEYLSYYIEHDELEKVKTELVSLKANIETEEFEQGQADINRAIFILEHIKQKTALQIKNIF